MRLCYVVTVHHDTGQLVSLGWTGLETNKQHLPHYLRDSTHAQNRLNVHISAYDYISKVSVMWLSFYFSNLIIWLNLSVNLSSQHLTQFLMHSDSCYYPRKTLCSLTKRKKLKIFISLSIIHCLHNWFLSRQAFISDERVFCFCQDPVRRKAGTWLPSCWSLSDGRHDSSLPLLFQCGTRLSVQTCTRTHQVEVKTSTMQHKDGETCKCKISYHLS